MDIDYGAVFGIDTGANEPAPAQQDAGEGVSNTETTTEPEATTENDAGEKETEPAEQSAEERAKQAAARRKRERDAAIEQARQEERQNAQRSLDETIKSLGLENPYTGQPITSKAEYDAWKRSEAEQKQADVAESAGMTEEEFGAFIDDLPQVRGYKQAAAAAQQQQMKRDLDEQIKEIGKLDPSVKSVEDLKNREEYSTIYAHVQKGISVIDAFKLANFDKLTADAGNAARQAALNSANSKEHLTPTGQRGAGAVPVPEAVKEKYRFLNPNATDAEIHAHYAKFHKN